MADESLERIQLLLDASSEGLRRELKRADQANDRFRREAERHYGRVDKALLKVDGAAKNVTRGLAAMAVGLGLRGLKNIATEAIEAADSLAKTSAQLGLTASRLQELRFGAERSGVATADLDKSMEQFVKRLGEAQAGTGTLLPNLTKYGVALRDAAGNARSAETVLSDYADALAGAATPQERLRLAVEAFGRSGAGMVNLLKDGSAGLENYADQARKAGVVLSDDLAARA